MGKIDDKPRRSDALLRDFTSNSKDNDSEYSQDPLMLKYTKQLQNHGIQAESGTPSNLVRTESSPVEHLRDQHGNHEVLVRGNRKEKFPTCTGKTGNQLDQGMKISRKIRPEESIARMLPASVKPNLPGPARTQKVSPDPALRKFVQGEGDSNRGEEGSSFLLSVDALEVKEHKEAWFDLPNNDTDKMPAVEGKGYSKTGDVGNEDSKRANEGKGNSKTPDVGIRDSKRADEGKGDSKTPDVGIRDSKRADEGKGDSKTPDVGIRDSKRADEGEGDSKTPDVGIRDSKRADEGKGYSKRADEEKRDSKTADKEKGDSKTADKGKRDSKRAYERKRDSKSAYEGKGDSKTADYGKKGSKTANEGKRDSKTADEGVRDSRRADEGEVPCFGREWCRQGSGMNGMTAISFLVVIKCMISLATAECEPQQPVKDFRFLLNNSICRDPKSNHPVCEDGFFFICAVYVNNSLGAGCVEDFCIRNGYCPMFTHRQLGEKEDFVIQEGRLCSKCNGSYIIPNWEKYPECYTVTPTTTRTPTMTGTFMTTLAPTTTKTSIATKMPNATGSISNETVTTQKMSSDLILGLAIGGGILALIVVVVFIVIILVVLKRNTERGQHYNRYLPSCLRSCYQRPEPAGTEMPNYNRGNQ